MKSLEELLKEAKTTNEILAHVHDLKGFANMPAFAGGKTIEKELVSEGWKQWVSVDVLKQWAEQLREPIKDIPHVDLDLFWEKYRQVQVAHWSKDEPFNAFMMGYILRTKEVLGSEAKL